MEDIATTSTKPVSMDIGGDCEAENEDGNIGWRFSQIKGNIEADESSSDGLFQFPSVINLLDLADIISCVEFSHNGELLATGDKGGRVVIFQRDQSV